MALKQRFTNTVHHTNKHQCEDKYNSWMIIFVCRRSYNNITVQTNYHTELTRDSHFVCTASVCVIWPTTSKLSIQCSNVTAVGQSNVTAHALVHAIFAVKGNRSKEFQNAGIWIGQLLVACTLCLPRKMSEYYKNRLNDINYVISKSISQNFRYIFGIHIFFSVMFYFA